VFKTQTGSSTNDFWRKPPCLKYLLTKFVISARLSKKSLNFIRADIEAGKVNSAKLFVPIAKTAL